MNGDRSPFLKKEVKCPCCGQRSPQRAFKSRMFVPEEKESDQHVVRYRWMVDNVSQVHPPYYFLMFCPHCHFCDIGEEFENPTSNAYAVRVAKAFQNAEQRTKLIAVLLAKHIDYDEIDQYSALNLHYLALFLQLLVDEELQDNYKIARLLLRVAWLYREAGGGEGEGAVQIPGVEDALDQFDRLDDELATARASLKRIVGALRSRIADVDGELAEGQTNPYREKIAVVSKHMDGLSREAFALKSVCRRDRAGKLLSGAQESGEAQYYTHPSYDAFFEQLKGVWPFAPSDEHEAMRMAIAYFEKALSTDARLDDSHTRQGVMSLIIDLFVRCDDIKSALAMVRGAHKSAFDTRVRYQQELRSKDKDELEKRRIKARMERANVALDQVSALRRTLLNQMYVRDKETIETVLKNYQGHPLEVIEEALSTAGIEPEQISALQERGGPLEGYGKKKKRGLF